MDRHQSWELRASPGRWPLVVRMFSLGNNEGRDLELGEVLLTVAIVCGLHQKTQIPQGQNNLDIHCLSLLEEVTPDLWTSGLKELTLTSADSCTSQKWACLSKAFNANTQILNYLFLCSLPLKEKLRVPPKFWLLRPKSSLWGMCLG